MKKTYSYKQARVFFATCFISGIIIGACTKDNSGITMPDQAVQNIDLGVASLSTIIANTSGPITSGLYTVTMTLTPGAMYTLQLVDIKGNVINSHGFIASEINTQKLLDYTAIPNGSYDLNLIDTSGRIMRVPVIIQH